MLRSSLLTLRKQLQRPQLPNHPHRKEIPRIHFIHISRHHIHILLRITLLRAVITKTPSRRRTSVLSRPPPKTQKPLHDHPGRKGPLQANRAYRSIIIPPNPTVNEISPPKKHPFQNRNETCHSEQGQRPGEESAVRVSRSSISSTIEGLWVAQRLKQDFRFERARLPAAPQSASKL